MKELYSKYLECGCRVTTDSRAITGGEIFFALRGENFDGNNYALKALETGAAWAVVNSDADLSDDSRLIPVSDPLQVLSALAVCHRLSVPGLRVLGLTGTNGKTTTKELTAAVLSRRYRVTATKGNLNNDIGVPLSLLSIRPDTEIAVIEMGASHPDDIAKLVKLSQPDFGLITNVGKAHLQGFGSFEGVKAAKGELYRWIGGHGGVTFINKDDAVLESMAEGLSLVGYGLDYQGASLLETSAENPYLGLRLKDAAVHTQLVGSYNAPNVLAALAVGEYFGVPRAEAIAAIEGYEPVNKRSQMVRTAANTLIVDAYNANPSSMNAALDNFSLMAGSAKLALLGDMRELGADSLAEHCAIVRKLLSLGIEACLVGEEFGKAAAECGASFKCFADSAALFDFLSANPVSGRCVLVKGSRGIEMEKVLGAL